MKSTAPTTRTELQAALEDARARTLGLVDDLDDRQLEVPLEDILNPFLWELGHVAWFQERWLLRRDGRDSLRRGTDELYDSTKDLHDTRWDRTFPTRVETLAYMGSVLDAALDRLGSIELDPDELSLHLLVLFHEDMHGEAFCYMRQTVAHPPPACADSSSVRPHGPLAGDVEHPGGLHELGARRNEVFVFDNEQWAHPQRVAPFRMARAPVTQAEFAAFCDDGGYDRRELWTEEGWSWREGERAEHPVYWRRECSGGWTRRHFDRWVPLEEHLPVHFVNAFEAEAFARWAGRRLPTELEWEYAAAGGDAGSDFVGARARRYPWGTEAPSGEHAHLDLCATGCADVGSHGAGDSARGLRQMVGNVWEWTSSPFLPYPGFTPGAYAEYSEPWFETHRVLRGGSFATRARLMRNTWRNFFLPCRRDVPTGIRLASSLD